jgi:trimeric autotransporter adhesin
MNMNCKAYAAVIGLTMLMAIGTAMGQTITVDTASDVVDFGGAQQVANLPGPDGKVSLAEAGLASDNTIGVQTIAFQVPQSEWEMQGFYPGRAVLRPFLGLTLFQTVIIDGTSQTAFTGDTNPNGGEVVILTSVYMNNSTAGAVRGLDNTVIQLTGGGSNVVQGNSICGINVSNSSASLVGGTTPGQGNSGGYVKITSSSNVVVVGNKLDRVRVLGNGPSQPRSINNRIGGPTEAERNFITGTGVRNSQGIPSGIAVEIFQTRGTIIENNWIGTTPDGLGQGNPFTTIGISMDDENHGTIIRNNRIAGIRALALPPRGNSYYVGRGIHINGTGRGLRIVGNKIGLNANNEPVLGSICGITTTNYFLGPVQNVFIGGTLPSEGNQIAGHDRQGILLSNAYSGVRILGNSIHDNGGLGIDLIDSAFQIGVTPNDLLDVDAGANGLQNYPVLQSATRLTNGVRVTGTMVSSPLSSFRVEFFASPTRDPSGFGEGKLFLGARTVSTDANGTASFAVSLPAVVSAGTFVTSTATLVGTGSTSEFSNGVEVP